MCKKLLIGKSICNKLQTLGDLYVIYYERKKIRNKVCFSFGLSEKARIGGK